LSGAAELRAALEGAEQEIELYRAVCGAIAQWRSFTLGAERLLRDVAGVFGAPAAALWLPDGERLRVRVVWSGRTVTVDTLLRVLGELHMPRGMGLAGRAWAHMAPVAPARSGSDDGSLERLSSALDGVTSVVAVPAVHRREVLAVLVLYAGDPLEPGERLMGAFESVGEQLGELLARRPGPLASPLTPRELEEVTLAAQGLSVQQIAQQMLLSAATVKTHLANVYGKIGVANRAGAVAYALREGLIE
jgi:DNA-binding CsgD family transcriptional regulator